MRQTTEKLSVTADISPPFVSIDESENESSLNTSQIPPKHTESVFDNVYLPKDDNSATLNNHSLPSERYDTNIYIPSDSDDSEYTPSNNSVSSSSTNESILANQTSDENDGQILRDLEMLKSQWTNKLTQNQSCDNNVCEDIISNIFQDSVELLFETDTFVQNQVGNSSQSDFSTTENKRTYNDPIVPNFREWTYSNFGNDIELGLDDVDQFLYERYVNEAKRVLKNVQCEIADISTDPVTNDLHPDLSPLDILNAFLPKYFLEKLCHCANRVLKEQQKPITTVTEMQGLVILQMLCSMYKESPTIVCDVKNSDFYLHLGIESERFFTVWNALSCNPTMRNNTSGDGDTWETKFEAGPQFIYEIEELIASINRKLLFVPGKTIISLDDDHIRLSSRCVPDLTSLRVINNPQKALGPVSNAACSALHHFVPASHHSRPNENIIDTWTRLVCLIQGKPTSSSLSAMTDTIFSSDRGYHTKETISFINTQLGAIGLGTHKKTLDYPFCFGDGPIAKKHKGMNICEKGTRAVYTATRKEKKGSSIEAVVYRESYSGRVAVMYHNCQQLFSRKKYTIVPQDRYRNICRRSQIEELQVVHEEVSHPENGARSMFNKQNENGREAVLRQMQKVTLLTYLQSEDPLWFILRAFIFTSRTAHSFVRCITSNYNDGIEGLAYGIKGKNIIELSPPISNNIDVVREILSRRFNKLCETIGLEKSQTSLPIISNERKQYVMSLTRQVIAGMLKEDVTNLLREINVPIPARARVAQLKELLRDEQTRFLQENDVLNENNNDQRETTAENHSKSVSKAVRTQLRATSLSSWVMRPLTSTVGMKEGSANEIHILRAIPVFLKTRECAFNNRGDPQGSSGNTMTSDSNFENGSPMSLSISFLKQTGLVTNSTEPYLGDSPDGIFALKSDNETLVAGVEVKTLTSITTISRACEFVNNHAELIVVEGVGRSKEADKIFKKAVWTTEHNVYIMQQLFKQTRFFSAQVQVTLQEEQESSMFV